MNSDLYMELFSPTQQKKPRFMALERAVLGQVADLATLFEDGAFDLENAAGFFLDTLGELSDVRRATPGEADDVFREELRQRIAMHHWNGRNESIRATLEKAFPDGDAVIIDNMDGTITGNVNFPCVAGVMARRYPR